MDLAAITEQGAHFRVNTPMQVREAVVTDTLVLVVEDEPSLREMLQLMVEDAFGVRAIVAGTAAEALRLADEHRPSLILLDIMLPGVDGLEVARRLRSNPATANIPIIAVTAGASRHDALAAGCTDHIAKPFDLQMLESKIGRCLK